MTILIRKARIVDPESDHHGQVRDILIRQGIIENIAEDITAEAEEILEADDLHASPGWVDIFTHCCDPGYEHRETLESGARAGATGGYTHLFVIPNTQPALQHKGMIEFVRNRQVSVPVKLHPIGAISRNIEGRELAEMYDMHASGAIAFSDGTSPVQSAGLLIKALEYVKAFDGILIQIPEDGSISPNGLMNEGVMSTQLGLQGKPSMAEEIMVARDIKLARYADSRLHFTGITVPKSLAYIRRAKEAGIAITCSTTPHHLFFTDEDLQGYDSNLKVTPPLRTQEDRKALLAAVLDGTIDCITTHHLPQHRDNKNCEFEYAYAGMIGLESCYGVLGRLDLPNEKIVELLSVNPRKIFGLPAGKLEIGKEADISVFLPNHKYRFEASDISSKSVNSAFLGKELKGRVLGTILGNQLFRRHVAGNADRNL